MANQYVNYVVINGTSKLDLRSDTVDAAHLVSGYTAHNAAGAPITGSLSFVTYYTGTSNPSSSQGSNGDIYLKTVS